MDDRTGAQALVAGLVATGTRYLFGIPGVHTLPLYDALADAPSITPIVTRHEAGAAYAADGYARVSGRAGVVSVVPGPGALNAASAVLCAYSDRTPMVLLTVEPPYPDRQGVVHEADLASIFHPFTKAQRRPADGQEMDTLLPQACALAERPPAGPVQLLLPQELLTAPAGAGRPYRATPSEPPDPDAIDQVLTFLERCSSPALVVGTGVLGMDRETLDVARKLGAPVFTDVAARGIIPEDHPLAAGLLSWPDANQILAASDGALVLGSRLSEISTLNWSVRFPDNLARVDAAPAQLRGNYRPSVAIRADPGAIMTELARRLPARRSPNRATGILHTSSLGTDTPSDPSPPGRLHPRAVVRALRSALPRDAIVATDGTATEFWLSDPAFPVLSPGGFLVPEIQQAMGYALSAAIGAALAAAEVDPGRPVVCVTGDGSLQMMLGELATAASLARQLTVVIFVDGYYNALRIYQDGLYGRRVGVTLDNPDFVALARSYGAHAEWIDDLDRLASAVRNAVSSPSFSIIAVSIDPAPLPERYRRRLERMQTS